MNVVEVSDASIEKIADAVVRKLADRKTENSSEKPNSCETCRYNSDEWDSPKCDGCSKAHSNYEPQTAGYISGEDFMKLFDEPQTDCPWK